MTNRQVLLLIAAFLMLTVGSFVWYIATWDARKVNRDATPIILPNKLPSEAPAFQERAVL